jgi:DNA-binding NarL/FixJ family response regulator
MRSARPPDQAFEWVLVDLSLPDGDGLELVRHLREKCPYLKILATSGFLVRTMPQAAIAAGATATLSKPTTASQLRDAVYRLLEPSGRWRGAPGCVRRLHAPGRGRIKVASRSLSSWRRAIVAQVPVLSSLR